MFKILKRLHQEPNMIQVVTNLRLNFRVIACQIVFRPIFFFLVRDRLEFIEWLPHFENQTFIRKNQSLYICIAKDECFYIKWYEKTVDFAAKGYMSISGR